MQQISLNIIAYLRSNISEKYEASIQPNLSKEINVCYIELEKGYLLEQAIESLEGFERIWLIYHFHKNNNWKPKVLPPRFDRKIGVFATRSPHRPSPIGISVCRLVKINKNKIYIENNDIIDGTPILDIKPYIPEHDAFQNSRIGWNEQNVKNNFDFRESHQFHTKLVNFDEAGFKKYIETVKQTINFKEWKNKNTRIKDLGQEHYQIRIKSWIIIFLKEQEIISFLDFQSAYSLNSLNNNPQIQLHDYEIHLKYHQLFGS